MKAADRRREILETLNAAEEPIRAVDLAERYGVSRQIIVGDIALLRASGEQILPTPYGYRIERQEPDDRNRTVLVCRHTAEETRDELYAIVDHGGKVLDVTVEHPVYGQLHGFLNIENRYDADQFCERLRETNAMTLSSLTGGIHLHTISCRDEASLRRIRDALASGGYLLED